MPTKYKRLLKTEEKEFQQLWLKNSWRVEILKKLFDCRPAAGKLVRVRRTFVVRYWGRVTECNIEQPRKMVSLSEIAFPQETLPGDFHHLLHQCWTSMGGQPVKFNGISLDRRSQLKHTVLWPLTLPSWKSNTVDLDWYGKLPIFQMIINKQDNFFYVFYDIW